MSKLLFNLIPTKVHRISLLIFISLIPAFLYSQSQTGMIRGTVKDAYTEVPIAGVTLILLHYDSVYQCQTNGLGVFSMDSVPLGRHDLALRAKGYQKFIKTGILVKANQDALLSLELEPTVYELDEVTLMPLEVKGKARNDMAMVSALSFDIEETRLYAGGLDDPVRLSANFPGVKPSPFVSDNIVSIRGNSPRGMRFRVEGIDIPNPNHFARIGSSGGSFTLFSNQVLANSDFFTSAFPAEYGNATAGVFDIKFRNGDDRRRRYAVQAGVLGIDLFTEGPFKMGGKASYLVNYRFAATNLVDLVVPNINVLTYQDLSFKLNFPTQKAGTFQIFGMGGLSDRLKPAIRDTTMEKWTRDLDRFENNLNSDMGIVGLTHKKLLGKSTVLHSAISGSYAALEDNKNYLDQNLEPQPREVNEYRYMPLTFTSSVSHTFSPRHIHKSGIIFSTTDHHYLSQKYDYIADSLFTRAQARGQTQTFQAYSQSRFEINERLTVTAGLHYLYFFLNQNQSLEPRVGLQFNVAPRHFLSAGIGKHSQTEHFATYFTLTTNQDGQLYRPNADLKLLKTWHYVLGYQGLLTDHIRLRAELYYQDLFDVPVEVAGTYTVLNIDELNQLRVLNNDGTAQNYGVDLGLERYLYGGFYYVFNASMYHSTYTDAQGQRHSTAFNNGYKFNALAGKEFSVGRKKGKNRLMGLNSTLSVIGGERYMPIDLAASRLARETVFDESSPYSLQENPLVILDLTLTLKHLHANRTGTWAFQLKNLLQSASADYREYDAYLDEVVSLVGSFIFPVISYKVEF